MSVSFVLSIWKVRFRFIPHHDYFPQFEWLPTAGAVGARPCDSRHVVKIVFDSEDLKLLPVAVDPDVLGGKPVFAGTRVPIEAMCTNLADGATLDECLAWFPTVSRDQAEAMLEYAFRTLAHAA